MSDSRIHAPPSTMARGASLAGTCLTQTPIFKNSSELKCYDCGKVQSRQVHLPGTACRAPTVLHARESALLFTPALEDQGCVCAAEAERIRERVLDSRFARLVRNVVQIALRIGILVVHGRRQNLIAQS